MLSQARVLITGCSRGLGFEMVNQLVNRSCPPRLVLATCRSPETAGRLQELSERHSIIKIIKLDVDDLDSFDGLRDEAGLETDRLDLLINNAGVSPKASRITMVTAEQMSRTLHTNTLAPLFLTKSLLPLLQKKDLTRNPSLIVNMSSILGSITENTKQGGLYPYRASKSALNAITRSLSIDLKHQNICAVSIHPGWVKTDMGGNNAPLTAKQSIKGVLELIEEFSPAEHNGNFYDNTGSKLGW